MFRGRGAHPKQGMIKSRIEPEDIVINCSKGSEVPKPPPGHRYAPGLPGQKIKYAIFQVEGCDPR